MTMTESQIVDLLARHLAAENAHRLGDTLATLTPDCEFVDHALGRRWVGREGAAECYRMWWDAFGVVVSGERLHLARDGVAVAETVWRGTHVGEFLGVAATGRTVEVAVAVVVECRDGLMAAERFYWDRAGLLAQLGVRDAA